MIVKKTSVLFILLQVGTLSHDESTHYLVEGLFYTTKITKGELKRVETLSPVQTLDLPI